MLFRSRRRGGRGRGRSARSAADAADGEEGDSAADAAERPPASQAASGEPPDGESPKPTRRTRAGASTARAATAKTSGTRRGAAKGSEVATGDAEEDKPATRRRRRSGTASSAKADAAQDGDAKEGTKAAGTRRTGTRAAGGAAPAEAKPTRRRTRKAAGESDGSAEPTRTAGRRRLPGRRRRELTPVIRHVADKVMLITELDERDQIAVLHDRMLIEHYITRSGARSMVGNIYLGKVQNVLPGMEAAFIDVGRGRNAVLYAGEVSYDEDVDGHTPRRIEQVLRTGKNVIVQVTKDPIGGKGARLTQEISLPGRFVVFVPNSETFGISRRLPDDERQRLKEILKGIRPPGHGLIVRTAADGASEEDLTADLRRLEEEWAAIDKSAKRGRAPRVLYEEPELTTRVVRDVFTEGEFTEIVTDSKRIHELVIEYLQRVAPELVAKVKMHEGPLSVMEAYHVTEQVHKALDRKVWLPSGGYLVIDRTEAMTVVDVNTGKHVSGANLEETVTKTNVEGAAEVGRQLRLRDIGGMIVIDFIDMLLDRNKDKVIQTLKNTMAEDKTRSQVFDHVSPLGLVEVTRKRVSAGLLESFSHTCPECEGRGIIVDHRV